MMDTQARGRVSNSAANSLPASKPGKISAAGQLDPILRNPLISYKVSALRGCFLAAERRFFPAVREMRTEAAIVKKPDLSAADLWAGPGTSLAKANLVLPYTPATLR
jgi:hypothetical protein